MFLVGRKLPVNKPYPSFMGGNGADGAHQCLASPGELEKQSSLDGISPEPRLLHAHGFMILTK